MLTGYREIEYPYSVKKFLLVTFTFVLILGATLVVVSRINKNNAQEMLYPLIVKMIDSFPDETNPKNIFGSKSELANKDILNILLLGIDRRSRAETGYRSDIMILLSINKKDKHVVLTSVPRDLWVHGGRINAIYVAEGWEGIQSAFETITGQKPERYILTDFKDFSWIVDAMDGVDVTVENTFTDSEYPVDETKTYQTISFTEGPTRLTGRTALIFARSRHGNNGEGSDWMRMKRQHLILKGMLTAVMHPKSLFNPMVVENAFNTVTQGKMDTNLTLEDAKFLWDFYKDKDQYTIDSLFMNSDYVYNPPMSDYGGAWVLIPRDPTNSAFHTVINNKLMGIPDAPESTLSQSTL